MPLQSRTRACVTLAGINASVFARLFGPPKGGHYVLLLLTGSCSSSTASPSSTTDTPAAFVMTWGSATFPTTGVGTTSAMPLVVTLWNNGTAGVPVSSVTTSNADEFPFSTTCQLAGTLAASSTCSVTARFRPGGTGRERER